MPTGAITGYIDVAQLVLYAFWIFFAGLIWYLHRENKREGYPLMSDRSNGRVAVQGYPAVPPPKTYKLAHGGEVQAPRAEAPQAVAARPTAGHPGAPLEPTGNPMLDGVGPAAYALRSDEPDLTVYGTPRLVPLRVATGHSVASGDPDPRGMPVIGGDGERGGVVRDIWVDRSEELIRYYEVETGSGSAARRVLLPATFAKVGDGRVSVRSIYGHQFAAVPGLRHPDQVTRLEEDRICAYYGGGTLYASAARAEPLL
jgi:photosynthetic reaction center H subunit